VGPWTQHARLVKFFFFLEEKRRQVEVLLLVGEEKIRNRRGEENKTRSCRRTRYRWKGKRKQVIGEEKTKDFFLFLLYIALCFIVKVLIVIYRT